MIPLVRALVLLYLLGILSSCAPMATPGGPSFSASEVRDIHPAIHQTVEYWEKNALRARLPLKEADILRGFILEYGNSNYKDYHSLIAAQTGTGIRVFTNKGELALNKEQSDRVSKVLETLASYTGSSGKNIESFVFDGNVYLLSLLSPNHVVKIPYYAPRLENQGAPEIALLDDLLNLGSSLEARSR